MFICAMRLRYRNVEASINLPRSGAIFFAASMSALHRLYRILELRLLLALELDLDDALDTLRPDHHRHAHVKIVELHIGP